MKLLGRKSKSKKQLGKIVRGLPRQEEPPFPEYGHGLDEEQEIYAPGSSDAFDPSLVMHPARGSHGGSASRSLRSGRSRRSSKSAPRYPDYYADERRDDQSTLPAASARYHDGCRYHDYDPTIGDATFRAGCNDPRIATMAAQPACRGIDQGTFDDISKTLFEVSTACLIREHELDDMVDIVRTAEVVPRNVRGDNSTRALRRDEGTLDPYLDARTVGTFKSSTRSLGQSFSLRSASTRRRSFSKSSRADHSEYDRSEYERSTTREQYRRTEPEPLIDPIVWARLNAIWDDIVWKATGCFQDTHDDIRQRAQGALARRSNPTMMDLNSLDTYSTPEPEND